MTNATITMSNEDPAAPQPVAMDGEQVVLVRKHELALLTSAARLLAAIWNEDLTTSDDLVDAAIAAGLTTEKEADGAEVETEVALSPDFYAALGDAELTCGILPEADDGD